MALAIPTCQRLFRPQTSPVDYRGGAEAVSSNSFPVYQGWVDFDALGAHFKMVIGGVSQGVFGDGGHLRARIGGTYGAADGDLACDLSASASSFGVFSASAVVANIWSGRLIVKGTGWGWASTFNFATLDLVPV